MNKAKPEDVNMQPVEFRITRSLAEYAQNLPGHWFKPLLVRGVCHVVPHSGLGTRFREPSCCRNPCCRWLVILRCEFLENLHFTFWLCYTDLTWIFRNKKIYSAHGDIDWSFESADYWLVIDHKLMNASVICLSQHFWLCTHFSWNMEHTISARWLPIPNLWSWPLSL